MIGSSSLYFVDGTSGFICEDDFCEEDYPTYPILSFFFGIFLLSGGIIISSFLISCSMENNSLYDHSSKDNSEEDGEEYEDDIPYEYKYVKEFEELMDNSELVLDETQKMNLSSSILMETTPNGDVVMSYEYDKEVPDRSKFVYYSNNRSIPYKYLDAVARKYVYLYKCPEIYVFIKDEIAKEIKRIEEEKTKEEVKKEEETKNNSVFASFKNYKNPTVKKRHILVTKNKYKHMGSIEDYEKSLLPKEERKEVKPISFSQFKQMTNPS
jgi:hypothetical protein